MPIKKKRKAKEFSVSVTCPKCGKWRKISMYGKSYNRSYFMNTLQQIIDGELCHECRDIIELPHLTGVSNGDS